MIRVLALLFFASLTLFAAGDATFEGKRTKCGCCCYVYGVYTWNTRNYILGR